MKITTRISFRVLTLVAVCLSAFLVPASAQVPAASTATPPDAFAALPAAEMVMVVDIQRILNDAVPRLLANDPAMLKKLNDGLDEMKTMTGLDFRAPSRIIVAVPSVDETTKSKLFKGVLVAQVNDADKLMSLILLSFSSPEMAGKLIERKYEGETLYELPKGSYPGPGGKLREVKFDLAMSALDGGTILFGTPAEVRSAIDASAGRGARANADLVAAATRLPNSLFGIAMVVPPSWKTELFEGKQKEGEGNSNSTDNQISLAVASITQINAALGLTPNGFDVLLAGRTGTDEQAKNLGDMLTGLRALATLEPPKDATGKMVQTLIKGVQILAEGNELQLKTELTRETIDAFVQQVKSEVEKAMPPPPTTKKKPPVRRTRRIRRGARA